MLLLDRFPNYYFDLIMWIISTLKQGEGNMKIWKHISVSMGRRMTMNDRMDVEINSYYNIAVIIIDFIYTRLYFEQVF